MGDWQVEGDSVSSRFGFLQWQGQIKDVIEIEFQLTVRKWLNTQVGNIGIAWNAQSMDTGYDESRPRRLAIISRAGTEVAICSQPAIPGAARERTSYRFPLNELVRMWARITREGIDMTVGEQKFSVPLSCQRTGALQLLVGRDSADAVFSNIRVTSTDTRGATWASSWRTSTSLRPRNGGLSPGTAWPADSFGHTLL